MLNGKSLVTFFLLTGISFQSDAALIWEWEYSENDLYVDVGDVIEIDVVVRNSVASTENLAITVQTNDGSWGDLVSGPDYVVVVLAPDFGPYIEPGQSVEYTMAQLVPRSTASNHGDIFLINALMYGFEYEFPPVFPPPTDGTGKFASEPLTVHFSAVPIPPAIALFISGIVGLIGVGKFA